MKWRNSRATLKLREELDALFPTRSKASDGTIGDAAHAARTSDHNPWVKDPSGVFDGVVTAIDLTDDDASGADMRKLVHWLATRSHDARIKYMIHEGRIYSSYAIGGYPAWAARPYSGPNGHFHHLHVSVESRPALFDDARPWGIAAAFAKAAPAPARPTIPTTPGQPPRENWTETLVNNLPVLRRGDSGQHVRNLQGLLIAARTVHPVNQEGYVDGDFGPATETDLREFQKREGLADDGVAGRASWAALLS